MDRFQLHLRILFPFLALILFFSSYCYSFESTISEDKLSLLANSKYWLRLGHYKKTIFGGYKGQIDNQKFYLANDGKFNPLSELKATLDLFLKSNNYKDDNFHPQCLYPARYRFIKSELPSTLTTAKCNDLNDWMNSLSPQGATLVYASSYPNNPGSTFGHTYLKIISNNDSRLQAGSAGSTSSSGSTTNSRTAHLDLLDYSISYAANTADAFGLTYAFNGIFGGYIGYFALQPSYMKVNEYSDREDRDLWEYNLNITEQDAKRMMYHFWELNQDAFFDYFFFDENCAYQLLTLIEVARLDWELTDSVWLYLTPADSIKLIANNPNSIKEVRYRPSLYKRVMKKIEQLQRDQKIIFKDIIEYKKPIEIVKEDAKTLETIASYLFFRKQAQLNKLDQQQTELYNKSFLLRSNLGAKSSIEEVTISAPKNDSPVDAHNSVQVGYSFGSSNTQTYNYNHTYQELTFRPALHDILNNTQGYSTFTHLEVLKMKLRYYNQKSKLYLEEWKFVDAISLTPYESIERKYSWQLDFKSYMLKDIGEADRLAISFRPSMGYSFTPTNEWFLLYSLLGINLEAQSIFKHYMRFGPMLKIGAISNLSKIYRLQLMAELIADVFQSSRQKYFHQYYLDQSFVLTQNLDLRLHLFWLNRSDERFNNYKEGSLTINYHY
ncbi:MAG: DUF4105 domain-containing protein [Oligoflexia bacterium]|nr:DUF4105 domain-containing protein [Oligoflexia bacterium]